MSFISLNSTEDSRIIEEYGNFDDMVYNENSYLKLVDLFKLL